MKFYIKEDSGSFMALPSEAPAPADFAEVDEAEYLAFESARMQEIEQRRTEGLDNKQNAKAKLVSALSGLTGLTESEVLDGLRS